MFSAFQTFGRLGAGARAVAAAWSPSALWPTGTEAGMWIDPSNLTSQWQDSTGTTPVATPGTVADSANPVGLALDIRAGATVLTDPGNHMLQATSAARPLESARVNALKYTENLYAGYWDKYATATWGSDYIQETAATQPYGFAPSGSPLSGVDAITLKAKIKAGIRSKIYFGVVGPGNTPGSQFVVDIAAKSATITDIAGSVGAFSYVEEGDWLRISCSTTGMAGAVTSIQIIAVASNLSYPFSYAGTDGEISLYITELSLTPTEQADLPYQSVPGDGSTYSSTGITPFQKYDGTDDGMATATFAAGTLINGMDCMIAVRRDSEARTILGLYNGTPPDQGVPDFNRFFGVAESASSAASFNECGTPTVWVDNVQLSGGTAVTRGTLASGLTVGEWHILELRNLDLSAWTAARFGAYYTYQFNGARGDILLYPSTASTTDKDAARQYLADKYGVTLA